MRNNLYPIRGNAIARIAVTNLFLRPVAIVLRDFHKTNYLFIRSFNQVFCLQFFLIGML